MGKLLTKEALLAKQELEIVKVDLEDGDYVYVRQMTGHERDVYEQTLLRKIRDSKGNVTGYEQSTEDFRAKLLVTTICDENGVLLLGPGDYKTLSQNMTAKRMSTIATVASKINKLAEEEEEIKNLEVGQADSSNSPSV